MTPRLLIGLISTAALAAPAQAIAGTSIASAGHVQCVLPTTWTFDPPVPPDAVSTPGGTVTVAVGGPPIGACRSSTAALYDTGAQPPVNPVVSTSETRAAMALAGGQLPKYPEDPFGVGQDWSYSGTCASMTLMPLDPDTYGVGTLVNGAVGTLAWSSSLMPPTQHFVVHEQHLLVEQHSPDDPNNVPPVPAGDSLDVEAFAGVRLPHDLNVQVRPNRCEVNGLATLKGFMVWNMNDAAYPPLY